MVSKKAVLPPPDLIRLNCQSCKQDFVGPFPEGCCSGTDCTCLGKPIDPVLCPKCAELTIWARTGITPSGRVWKKVYARPGVVYTEGEITLPIFEGSVDSGECIRECLTCRAECSTRGKYPTLFSPANPELFHNQQIDKDE